MMIEFVARPNQELSDHLSNVSALAADFLHPTGMPKTGELIGYLHDAGKYSKLFQQYIRSVTKIIDTEDVDYVDAQGMKGKIDHSTAGAQWIWDKRSEGVTLLAAQMMALAIASHHSGLIDCVTKDGNDTFDKRMSKDDAKTFYSEVITHLSKHVLKLSQLHEDSVKELVRGCKKISAIPELNAETQQFHLGLLTRLQLSCLVDADRLDSAGRRPRSLETWQNSINTFERNIANFKADTEVKRIRFGISEKCLSFAENKPGIYSLTVPTGGGKTLSSLRFALHHAKQHGLERIFYIVPYTSIIEQNAEEARKILEDNDPDNPLILEHHSNLTPKTDTEQNRQYAENWESPVVFTTTVQFLESLFASGTRGLRRMHNLNKSVIIFDEPQSLPLKVTHLFNNALNFLHHLGGSTVVLCTATQPCLDKVDAYKGRLHFSQNNGKASEIMPDCRKLFDALKRVTVINKIRSKGYPNSDIANFLMGNFCEEINSQLFIANTKKVARGVYLYLRDYTPEIPIYHLSTSMCPAHRKQILDCIKEKLDNSEKLICVSTQLIEAGVNISFDSVTRSLAGLDSIAQAAGRCNRHGESTHKGKVFIINPSAENLSSLPEISIAQEKTLRVLNEFKKPTDEPDLIGLQAIERFYELYFFERSHEMDYPIEGGYTLFDLLSANELGLRSHQRKNKHLPAYPLKQAFMTAGKHFQVIDAPTEGIIVPFDDSARELIGKLCALQFSPVETFKLLKCAQRFSVNLFSTDRAKLQNERALYETQPNSGIFYLNERFYSKDFGINFEGTSPLKFQYI